jgi:hypothetical protein
MHLPSAAKLWHMPGRQALPIAPLIPDRFEPLEVQATSYFAESVKMLSFSIRSISSFVPFGIRHVYAINMQIPFLLNSIEHIFAIVKQMFLLWVQISVPVKSKKHCYC